MYKAFVEDATGETTIWINGHQVLGTWVKGCLLKIPYYDEWRIEYYIIEEVDCRDSIYDIYRYAHKVIPETVCEAIYGLKDSQGNQIYNHDIVECTVIRNGGTYYNWERSINKNHGKCRTLPMEFYYNDKPFGDCICGYTFRPTEHAKLLIKEYEKPVGPEKTQQNINWYNIEREDLIKVVGTIFDKEN